MFIFTFTKLTKLNWITVELLYSHVEIITNALKK